MKHIGENDLSNLNGLFQSEGLHFELLPRGGTEGFLNPSSQYICENMLDEACDMIEKYYAGQGENVVFKEKGYVFEVC